MSVDEREFGFFLCAFMVYAFPYLTSLYWFPLLEDGISHVQVWASQDYPTHIQWNYIFNHFIQKVIVDGRLEFSLLVHSQLYIFPYPS